MKLREKKHEFLYYSLNFIFIAALSLLIVWSYVINKEDKAANYFISSNAIAFLPDSRVKSESDFRKEISRLIDDYSLSTVEKDEDNNIVNIEVVKSGNVETPDLKNGRLITDQELQKGNPVAVAGEKVLNSKMVRKRNNSFFYFFNNKEFKIVGIIKKSQNGLSNVVFMPFTEKQHGKFIIDGSDHEKIESNFRKIKSKYSLTRVENTRDALQGTVNNLKIQNTLMIIIGVFITILMIIFNRYYYDEAKSEVSVKVMMGLNRRLILSEMLKPVLVMFVLTMMINFILFLVLNYIKTVFWVAMLQTSIYVIIAAIVMYTYFYCRNNIVNSNL